MKSLLIKAMLSERQRRNPLSFSSYHLLRGILRRVSEPRCGKEEFARGSSTFPYRVAVGFRAASFAALAEQASSSICHLHSSAMLLLPSDCRVGFCVVFASSDLAKGDPVAALHHSNRERTIAVAAAAATKPFAEQASSCSHLCECSFGFASVGEKHFRWRSAPLLPSSSSSNLLLGGILH